MKRIGKLWTTGIVLAALHACWGCTDRPPAEAEEAAGAVEETAYSVSPAITDDVQRVVDAPPVREAFRAIEQLEPRTYSDHIDLTQIPAPPFGEARRAAAYAALLSEAGADSVWTDEEGNVLALRRGTRGGRRVAIAAHLDTVFPEGTDVTVVARGDTLFAPGIGDDARGLVEVLTVLRAIHRAGIRTPDDLFFIGTVGEEGLGDLRGVKHLFREDGPGIDAWIAIDGGPDRQHRASRARVAPLQGRVPGARGAFLGRVRAGQPAPCPR